MLRIAIISSFCLVLIFSCSEDTSIASTPELTSYSDTIPNYSDFLNKIKEDKKAWKNDSLFHQQFYKLFAIDLVRYWEKTPWDFNGTTRTPQSGQIACGYFVTNTLTDLGFKLGRTHLAQVPSSEMIDSVCSSVKRLAGFEKFNTYLSTQKDYQVFIVGLDTHTGYILKDPSGCYFLHSNYIQRKGVMKEPIDESEALQASNAFVIGSLSENTSRINQWLSR